MDKGYQPPQSVSWEIFQAYGFDPIFREAFQDDFGKGEVQLSREVLTTICTYRDRSRSGYVWDENLLIDHLAAMLLSPSYLDQFWQIRRNKIQAGCDAEWRRHTSAIKKELDPLKWKQLWLLLGSVFAVSLLSLVVLAPLTWNSVIAQFGAMILIVLELIGVGYLLFKLPISKRIPLLEKEIDNISYLKLAEGYWELLKAEFIALWVDMQRVQVRV